MNVQKDLKAFCEPRLAEYVGESLRRIHFHGLDVEMANLTVQQPRIDILKVEVHKGIRMERAANASKDHYTVQASKWLG